MRTILPTLAALLTVLAVSGCGDVQVRERAVSIQDGAIMREGVLKGGIHPTFQQPVIEVKPGAIEVKPGAFQGPAINVEKEAVKLVVETGAVEIHEGAININLIGKRKSPYIASEEVKESLKALAALGNINDLPQELQAKIRTNEKLYQQAIKLLLEMIQEHNSKYAEPPKDDDD